MWGGPDVDPAQQGWTKAGHRHSPSPDHLPPLFARLTPFFVPDNPPDPPLGFTLSAALLVSKLVYG